MNKDKDPQEVAFSAFIKAQSEMNNASLNSTNPHFKNRYADLPAVLDAVKKPLNDNDLFLTHHAADNEMICRIVHVNGTLVADSSFPIDGKNGPQKAAASRTYAKRYTLQDVCGIASDDDDDGNTAQQAHDVAAKKKVSEIEIGVIEDLMKRAGVTIDQFANRFSVAKIADLPASQYSTACNLLKQRIKGDQ